LGKILFLTKNIFGKNPIFFPKNSFLGKIQFSEKNPIFWEKFDFFSIIFNQFWIILPFWKGFQ
jgi:hypothetical protein